MSTFQPNQCLITQTREKPSRDLLFSGILLIFPIRMMDSADHTGKLDYQSFEKLFKDYYPYLCSFARKYIDDLDECKDIVHNVFLNLWNKRDELDTHTTLKSYLFKSVHNRCLNHIRDNKKIVHHDMPMESHALGGYIESTDYVEVSELETRIKNAIDDLPENCRRIFILSRFEEKKYAEIAEIMQVSIKTVEAQMTRALKTLREKLSDYLVTLYILSWLWLG